MMKRGMKRQSEGGRGTRLKGKLKTEAAARWVTAEREKMAKGEQPVKRGDTTHTLELGTDEPAEEKGILERQRKLSEYKQGTKKKKKDI